MMFEKKAMRFIVINKFHSFFLKNRVVYDKNFNFILFCLKVRIRLSNVNSLYFVVRT